MNTMTDLTISLWSIGIAVILAVIFYNFWQECKAKKNVERAFGQHQDDVLMKSTEQTSGIVSDAVNDISKIPLSKIISSSAHSPAINTELIERREPLLNDPNKEGVNNSGNSAALISSSSTTSSTFKNDAFQVANSKTSLMPIDEFIDCIISMEFDSPIKGSTLLEEIQSFRRIGSKPVNFMGINTEGKHEIITQAALFTHLLTGAQLVTRNGALNELEYSELVMKLRQIADNLNAYPNIPDMKQVIDTARNLAAFVTDYDTQLSVNIKTSGAPWGISTLLIALEKHGFDIRPDGRLVMLDGEGGALFTLSTNCSVSEQATSRITLLLDVPCVAPERGAFNAMVSCAKLLALRLGGNLVDDENQLLDDVTLNQIQQQIELFYSEMEAAEIPAGSVRASRLFS